MSDRILELRNIGKTFSGVNVLRGIDLTLERGEVHALLGENGAGKSTLIKIISGYQLPDKGGEILLEGKPVTFRRPKDAKDAHIHTIYQELSLCPDMTVAENIVIDKQDRYKGFLLDNRAFVKLAQEALDRLGLDINPNERVRNLSIAQQQVVEIAKAISSDARVILMDEPTSSISQKDSERLLEIIRTLKSHGVTIIYISHRLHEIGQIADRVTVLRDGNLVGTVAASEVTNQKLINMMVGREHTNVYPKRDVALGECVLRVENLCSDAFEDVSFTVRRGEILGIGGLVGAKRTEIMETLFGLRPIRSGKIYLNGREFDPKNPKKCIENRIAFVTEDRKKSGLVLVLSVLENTNMVNAASMNRRGVLNWKQLADVAQKQKQSLNIRLNSIAQPVSTLSGGNQQKVVLAKWMEFNPQLVLFDEPTRGIDIGAKTEIYNIMGELAANGAAIVMVSSELPELVSVTDEIVVMCEGRMTGLVPKSAATQETIMTLAAPHS